MFLQQAVALRDRLEVTATLRHDYFGDGFYDALHPSLSASWLLRPYGPGLLGELRVRAAYGSAGRRAFFGRPERTRELTGGVDGTLLAGRAAWRVTLYDMRSSVTTVYPILPSGGGGVLVEGARISNRGVEISVEGQLLNQSDAALALTFTAWGNRNRVIGMDGPPIFGTFSRYQPGYPAGGYWAVPVGYADANRDGIIVPSEVVLGSEAVWAGTPYPTQGAALAAELGLRRVLRLGASFEYAAGHHLFNVTEAAACEFQRCKAMVDPSTPLARQADAVALLIAGRFTPGFMEDADFLKLREVWVSVAAPRALAAALRGRSATIALVGRNLLTWTGYSGVDPEAVMPEPRVGQIESIVDRLALPALPEWSLRVRLSY